VENQIHHKRRKKKSLTQNKRTKENVISNFWMYWWRNLTHTSDERRVRWSRHFRWTILSTCRRH